MKSVNWFGSIGLALLVSLSVAAAQKQPFTAERSWELQRIAAPTISPDGTWAVVSSSKPDLKENKISSDLWLYSTDGRIERRLTSHASSDSAPLFSPDGLRVAFIAQRDDDKAPQIYLIALDGGEATRVTAWPTGVGQVKWSPDGRSLYFVARAWSDLNSASEQAQRLKEREDSKAKGQVYEGSSFSAWDTILDDRQFHLFRAPLDGGEPTNVTQTTGLVLPRQNIQLDSIVYDIAPDGREIAFVADADPTLNDSNFEIFLIPASGGAPKNITADNPGPDSTPLYSPDGSRLAFNRQTIKGFYADTRRLMIYERAGGNLREIAADHDRSKDGLTWSADSKRLIGAIDDAGVNRLYEYTLDGTWRAITGMPSFAGPALAKNGTLVALRQSFLEPPTLVRVDASTGNATKLSTLNDSVLENSALGSFESVNYSGANGDSIQMWVNYPPGFDKSKKYPLLLLIHGGPHNGVTSGMQYRWNAQVFGSWGMVTGWPNFHGSSGFGQKFTDSINPQQDALPYEDVIRAAEWFKAQPWIDSERMVAGGGSYGGYLTSIILGRPHPFKALIAHAAVYNWYTQYGSDYMTERPRFGGFWEPRMQSVVQTGSPHLGAGSFQTPTLVIHGQKDMRVPVNHGIELYQTLLMRGIPTRLLYYPDENHWILKPQNSVQWYSEVKRWIERWIKL
jgi:dipeptidyl aminopeptidase/acylaminoacyl peptidase